MLKRDDELNCQFLSVFIHVVPNLRINKQSFYLEDSNYVHFRKQLFIADAMLCCSR